MTVPVVIALFTALTLGLGAAMTQYRLQDAAHAHARVMSLEGDPGLLPEAPEGARHRAWSEEDLVCVGYESTFDPGVMTLFPITLEASACALDASAQ